MSTSTTDNIMSMSALTGLTATNNDTTSSTMSNFSLTIAAVPPGCIVFNFPVGDNADDLVSSRTEAIIGQLRTNIVIPLLCLIGVPTNCINMEIFYKLGLSQRINLCLFSLSLADVLYHIHGILVHAEIFLGQFTDKFGSGDIFELLANHNLIGMYGFSFASQLMTAIIASERCFCIVSPLRSQNHLKTQTMAAIILFSFLVIVGGEFFVCLRFGVICIFNPMTNTTVKIMYGSTQFYRENKSVIDLLDNVIYGFLLTGLFCFLVSVTTGVTVVKLRQAITWRTKTSSSRVSGRELALTQTLVCTSILFLVCVFPNLLFRLVSFTVPDLNLGGRYHNLFLTMTSLVVTLNYLYSSLNFFIYYNMGSRFKEIFWSCCYKKKTLKSLTRKLKVVL